MKNNENVYFEKNSIDTLTSGTKLKRNQNCLILNILKILVNKKIMKMFILLKTLSIHLHQVQKLKEIKTAQF